MDLFFFFTTQESRIQPLSCYLFLEHALEGEIASKKGPPTQGAKTGTSRHVAKTGTSGTAPGLMFASVCSSWETLFGQKTGIIHSEFHFGGIYLARNGTFLPFFPLRRVESGFFPLTYAKYLSLRKGLSGKHTTQTLVYCRVASSRPVRSNLRH